MKKLLLIPIFMSITLYVVGQSVGISQLNITPVSLFHVHSNVEGQLFQLSNLNTSGGNTPTINSGFNIGIDGSKNISLNQYEDANMVFKINNTQSGLLNKDKSLTLFGYKSGISTTGWYNTAFGAYALANNTTGSSNTAVGMDASYYFGAGSGNTAIGMYSLEGNAAPAINTGSYNTAIGYAAGSGWEAGTSMPNNLQVTTGSYNTFLGYGSASSASNFINATAIGAYSLAGASNTLVLGSINGVNNATSSTKVGIGTTTPSHFLEVEGDANGSAVFYSKNKKSTAGELCSGTSGIFSEIDNSSGTSYGFGSIGWYSNTSTPQVLGAGVYGNSGDAGAYGVLGKYNDSNYGYMGGSGYGVYGKGSTWAGYFDGNTYVSGKIGIGTNEPGNLLEIVGGASGSETSVLQIRSNFTTDNTATTLRFTNSTTSSSVYGAAEICALRPNSSGASLIFRAAKGASVNEIMRLEGLTGNVGVGTTSPGATLDVKGAIRLSGSTSGYVGFSPAATAGFYDIYTALC